MSTKTKKRKTGETTDVLGQLVMLQARDRAMQQILVDEGMLAESVMMTRTMIDRQREIDRIRDRRKRNRA